MRVMFILFLALGLLAGIPSALATGIGSECETYRASSIPILHPALDVGEVQLCDEDRDGAYDTVAFQTRYVQNEGVVSVTNEERQRHNHQDRDIRAQAHFEPGTPGKTIVYQDFRADDDGDDRQVDRFSSTGGIYTHVGEPRYVLTGEDAENNNVPQEYGMLVCPVITCAGPADVPEVPDRIDLPDTVVHVPPFGYFP